MVQRSVPRWLGMREMQSRRAGAEVKVKEEPMANREQKGNREKRKPKKEKPKGAPVVSSFGVPSKPSGKGK
jgi:hypothetical protein